MPRRRSACLPPPAVPLVHPAINHQRGQASAYLLYPEEAHHVGVVQVSNHANLVLRSLESDRQWDGERRWRGWPAASLDIWRNGSSHSARRQAPTPRLTQSSVVLVLCSRHPQSSCILYSVVILRVGVKCEQQQTGGDYYRLTTRAGRFEQG